MHLVEAHTSAVLDRVEKGMLDVIGGDVQRTARFQSPDPETINEFKAQLRPKVTDLVKKVRGDL